MPTVPQPKTNKVYLPSTNIEGIAEDQKLYVVYKDQLTIADLLVYNPEAGELEAGINILARTIVEWNLTDESGTVLPIDPNTIGTLPVQDLNTLVAIVEEITPDQNLVSSNQKKT